jgi:hypothetical protein
VRPAGGKERHRLIQGDFWQLTTRRGQRAGCQLSIPTL